MQPRGGGRVTGGRIHPPCLRRHQNPVQSLRRGAVPAQLRRRSLRTAANVTRARSFFRGRISYITIPCSTTAVAAIDHLQCYGTTYTFQAGPRHPRRAKQLPIQKTTITRAVHYNRTAKNVTRNLARLKFRSPYSKLAYDNRRVRETAAVSCHQCEAQLRSLAVAG